MHVNERIFECLYYVQYVCLYIFFCMHVIWEVCAIPWCHSILIIVCVFQLIMCYLLCSLFRSGASPTGQQSYRNPGRAANKSIHPPSLISTPMPHHHAYSRDGRLVQVCMYVCMYVCMHIIQPCHQTYYYCYYLVEQIGPSSLRIVDVHFV